MQESNAFYYGRGEETAWEPPAEALPTKAPPANWWAGHEGWIEKKSGGKEGSVKKKMFQKWCVAALPLLAATAAAASAAGCLCCCCLCWLLMEPNPIPLRPTLLLPRLSTRDKRYFVLPPSTNGTLLTYYKSDEAFRKREPPLGSVNCDGAHAQMLRPRRLLCRCCFCFSFYC